MHAATLGRKAALSAAIALVITARTDVTAQEDALEEVVVTGSRIARRDFSAQSPIVTVDADSFNARTNVGLEATLEPAATVHRGRHTGIDELRVDTVSAATAAPGAATVNLRGLGLNRSLVLLDGRRCNPSTVSSSST